MTGLGPATGVMPLTEMPAVAVNEMFCGVAIDSFSLKTGCGSSESNRPYWRLWASLAHQGLLPHWLRGLDSHQRPSAYEADELLLLHPASNRLLSAYLHV